MPISKNEIKFISSLKLKKFRDSEKLFVVEGTKLVTELLNQNKFRIKVIYCLETCTVYIPDSVNKEVIKQSDLERISSLKNPNQIVAIAHQADNTELDVTEENLILLLDDINDPGNLGTIIRSADWFGITQIICSTKSVELYNPKVIQSSMGAVFRCSVMYAELEETVELLASSDFDLYGAEMDGQNAFETTFKSKTGIVMGSESHGISDQIKKKLKSLTIPKKGESESLNVAIACGILVGLYAKGRS